MVQTNKLAAAFLEYDGDMSTLIFPQKNQNIYDFSDIILTFVWTNRAPKGR